MSSDKKSRFEPPSDEEWTPPALVTQENKFWKRAKENPFVPIGCLATVGALSFGLVSFKRGNMAMSQTMMRMRVVAQGGTVLALIGGMLVAGMNMTKKE